MLNAALCPGCRQPMERTEEREYDSYSKRIYVFATWRCTNGLCTDGAKYAKLAQVEQYDQRTSVENQKIREGLAAGNARRAEALQQIIDERLKQG